MTGSSGSADRMAPLRPYRLPLAVLLVLGILALVWTVLARSAGADKLAGLDLSSDSPVDVEIALDFEPEQFHLERFQSVGRYLGWHDGRATVRDADPDALRALARAYWVADIRPAASPAS